MIITVIVVGVILTFLSFSLINKKWLRIPLGIISALIMIAGIAGASANDFWHWGMKKENTTKNIEIYSMGGDQLPAGIIVKQPIDKGGKNDAYVYALDAKGKNTGKSIPGLITTIKLVKSDDLKATRETTTEKYKFENKIYEMFFSVLGVQDEKVKKEITISIPKDTWIDINAKQAAKIKETFANISNSTDKNLLMLAAKMQQQLKTGANVDAAKTNVQMFNYILSN